MARRFCLRLSHVIPSFQNCRSKDDASPIPPLPSVSPSLTTRPSTLTSLRRRNPPVISGGGAGGGHFSSAKGDAKANNFPPARETPAYPWRKEEKWYVVTYAASGDYGSDNFPSSLRQKIDSDDDGDIFPPARGTRRMTSGRAAIILTKRTTTRPRCWSHRWTTHQTTCFDGEG